MQKNMHFVQTHLIKDAFDINMLIIFKILREYKQPSNDLNNSSFHTSNFNNITNNKRKSYFHNSY